MVLFVLGAAFAAVFVFQLLTVLFEGDPTGFMRVPSQRAEIVAAQIGRQPVIAEGDGHDGYYFFEQAVDPLLSDRRIVSTFDDPAHRASRLLYPLVAGLFGLVPAEFIPWMLIAVNIAMFGLGSAATGHYAQRLGASNAIGLFFAMNIGLLFATSVDGASVMATAFLVLGLIALQGGRDRVAIGWLALSVLTREFYLVFAAGALLFRWRSQPVKAVVSVASIALPYVAVRALYTISFRSVDVAESATARNFGVPLQGFVDSFESWMESTTLEALGIGVVLVSAIGLLITFFRRPSQLSAAGVAALPLMIVLTDDVIAEAYDFSRVFAPLPILFVLALLSTTSRHLARLRQSEDGSHATPDS